MTRDTTIKLAVLVSKCNWAIPESKDTPPRKTVSLDGFLDIISFPNVLARALNFMDS